jgi:hypothetical protein
MGADTTSFHFKRLYRPRSRRGRSRQEQIARGLATLVRETLGEDPFSGTIYVFHSKGADGVKMVAWDSTGLQSRRDATDVGAIGRACGGYTGKSGPLSRVCRRFQGVFFAAHFGLPIG